MKKCLKNGFCPVDYRDVNHLGGRYINGTTEAQNPRDFPDYDGINVYGDIGQNFNMTSVFANLVVPGMVAGGLLSPALGGQVAFIFNNLAPNYFGSTVINTGGYNEVDLIDNKASTRQYITINFRWII